jgi:hypothetical protein
MSRVVLDSSDPLDDECNPRQRPEARLKFMSPRSSAQRNIHAAHLLCIEFRLSPCSSCAFQAFCAAPPVL